MPAESDSRAHELARLPWSREVVADPDGVFVASVPELEGCFAEGETVEEALASLDEVLPQWLAIALDSGQDVPPPRQLAEEEFSGRFSVRVPRTLHRRLVERATHEGCSLNQLVTAVLTEGLAPATGRLAEAGALDAHEDLVAVSVRSAPQSIGPLKGIATHLRDRGAINLACLVYAHAASRVHEAEGAPAASRDLGMAAALARRSGRWMLAESLFRESIQLDATNLRSLSALGQLLHHQQRHDDAIGYLERAANVDNHARLFLGWSRLLAGLERHDDQEIDTGTAILVDALRNWADSNPDDNERSSWERQVRRLRALGSRFATEVQQLVEFANAHAGWGAIELDTITEPAGLEESEAPESTMQATEEGGPYRS